MCVLSAFILQMFSALLCGRIFELQFPRDLVFYNPLQVLFRMLGWLAEPQYFLQVLSSYNRWRSWAREHGLTVFSASPFHFVIYLRHLMTEAKTASPLESAVHSVAWFHQLGGEPSPSDHSLVKSILRCGAFAGQSNIQEGAYHSLSVRAVSCLQGRLDGLFVQYSSGSYYWRALSE